MDTFLQLLDSTTSEMQSVNLLQQHRSQMFKYIP